MKKKMLLILLCCVTVLLIGSFGVLGEDDPFAPGPSDDGACDPTGEDWGDPIEAPPEMTEDDWFYEALTALMEENVIKGYEDGTIRPYANVTRAEFVTLLARLDGADVSQYTTHPFTDATAAWYQSYIAWAAAEEYVNGTSPTTFEPDAKITRQEMMTILARYVGREHYSEYNFQLPYVDMGDFYDHNLIADWALSAVYGLRSLGLAQGEKKTVTGAEVCVINPLGFASRAEAGTMLYRIMIYEWGD